MFKAGVTRRTLDRRITRVRQASYERGGMNVLIRQVDILDGSGSPAVRGDVGLEGDRIVAIGDLSAGVANRTIEGAGLAASPGFIDMHSHSDFTLPINPRAESKVRQGVTTEVIGQCGLSPAPLSPMQAERMAAAYPDLPWTWSTFAEYVDYLRTCGLSVNVVPLPSVLWISMYPLWSFTVPHTTAKPSPVPLLPITFLV